MTRRLFSLLLLFVLIPQTGAACFGPKLYLGVGAGAQADVLFELVALYVKEKTGVETVRVDLKGEAPLEALRAERVDLAFDPLAGDATTLLAVDGLPRLVSGKRPLEDLQFTTVAPALRKLGGVLTARQVTELAAEVDRGASAAAAARRFLMARGWI